MTVGQPSPAKPPAAPPVKKPPEVTSPELEHLRMLKADIEEAIKGGLSEEELADWNKKLGDVKLEMEREAERASKLPPEQRAAAMKALAVRGEEDKQGRVKAYADKAQEYAPAIEKLLNDLPVKLPAGDPSRSALMALHNGLQDELMALQAGNMVAAQRINFQNKARLSAYRKFVSR